jgi:hypothetical protein
MSTSSLLEANDIVWELVEKPFSVQQNIIVFIRRDKHQIFRHARSGRFSNVVVFKERMA